MIELNYCVKKRIQISRKNPQLASVQNNSDGVL